MSYQTQILSQHGERKITAIKVDPDRQLDILPKYLGAHMLLGEDLIYAYMRRLCESYQGGLWSFYETSNGAFFMAPEQEEKCLITWADNWYEGTMSAEAAGLTATLYAIGHLANQTRQDRFIELFHALREFAMDHPEAGEVMAAID